MKNTAKFTAAKQTALQVGIRWSYKIENERLYQMLEAKGWRWHNGKWIEASKPAQVTRS